MHGAVPRCGMSETAEPKPHPMTPDGEPTRGPYKATQGTEDDMDRWSVVADNGTSPWVLAIIENGQPGDCCETEGCTAHLFAASWDMREALEVIRDADEDCKMDGRPRWLTPGVRAKIDAALAKAKGGAQ